MTIRFYDHDEVTDSPHFVVRDPNKEIKEKSHNGRTYRKVGITHEAHSVLWSMGQIFKGIFFGAIGVVTFPFSLCCGRSTSHSCFKSFLRSLQQAWRREETVSVYVLRLLEQPYFQGPHVPQGNNFPVRPLGTPRPPVSDPRPEWTTPFHSPAAIPTQPLLFSPEEQSIEVAMKAVEQRFEHANSEWERGNLRASEKCMGETFELVKEWIERAPDSLDRALAFARLLAKLEYSDDAYNIYSTLLKENPENVALKKEFIAFALEFEITEGVLSQLEEVVRLEPNNIEMRIHYAEALREEWRGNEAEEQYRQVLALDADHANARLGLAMTLSRRNAVDEACEEFKKAMAIAPENAMIHFEYARFSKRNDQVNESEEHYRKALELDPLDAAIREEYLNLLERLGRQEDIIRICEEGFNLHVDPTSFEQLYCRILGQQRKFEKLELYCQQRLSEEPDALEIRNIYAYVLAEQGKEEAAIQQFSAILEQAPGRSDVLEVYFDMLAFFRREEEILLYHQKRVAEEKNDVDGDFIYAKTLVKLGKLEEAEAEFCTLLRQVSRTNHVRKSIENQYFQVLNKLGKSESVEQWIQNAIQEDPGNFKSYEQLANLWQEQRQIDKAIQVIESFLAEYPDRDDKALSMLMRLLEGARKYEELKRLYENRLGINPNDYQMRRKYGDLLNRLNDCEGAAEQYRLALELDFHSYYLDNYYVILRRIGKGGEILPFHETLLERKPNDLQIRSSYAKYLTYEGRFPEAAGQYEEILKSDGENRLNNVRVEFAELLTQMGRLDEAAEQYRQALRSAPAHFHDYDAYFRLLADLNRGQEIEPCYQFLIESGRQDVRMSYALWLKDQNRLAEAAEQFREALKTDLGYLNSMPYLEVLEALNQFDEIEQYFEQKIRNADEPVGARMEYARYLEERNRLAEAEEQLRLCIEVDPKTLYARDQYIAILHKQDKFDELNRFYLEAIAKSQGEELELHQNYVRFLDAQNKMEEAAQECLKLTTLYPMETRVWGSLNGHFEHLGRLEELEQLYLRVIEANPDNAAARLGFAEYLRERDKEAEAESQYKEVLKIDSKNISARKSYIAFLSHEERYDDAIKVCEEGMEQDQDSLFGGLRAEYADLLARGGFKEKAAEQYRILIDQGRYYYQWRLDELEGK